MEIKLQTYAWKQILCLKLEQQAGICYIVIFI